MDMQIQRTEFGPEGVFGQLTAGSRLLAFTLEHSYGGVSKIPAGNYRCVRGIHQLEHGGPFETFEITGVAGHDGILFHVGNSQADSSGCVLLGSSRSGRWILQSREAFERFMSIQAGLEAFQLAVWD